MFHQQFEIAFAILDVTFDFIKRVTSLRHDLLIAELFDIKKNDAGFDNALFTNAGEIWINEQIIKSRKHKKLGQRERRLRELTNNPG